MNLKFEGSLVNSFFKINQQYFYFSVYLSTFKIHYSKINRLEELNETNNILFKKK